MAINTFLGTATTVIQVDTFTPANVEVGDEFILTVEGFDGQTASVSYTAAIAIVSDVTEGLELAWSLSSDDLVTPITIADITTAVTLTADVAGVAFNVTPSTVEGGGTGDQTFIRTATTPNGGPNDWSDPTNWSLGTIPGDTAGEDVFLKESSVSILYGLDQSGISNVLDSLHVNQSYLGTIGYDGVVGRIGDYLQIKATRLFVGENFYTTTQSGSGRLKIDLGTTASDVIVYNTGSSLSTTRPALRLLADNSATVIREVRRGTVGIAFTEGELSEVDTVLLSYNRQITSDATLTIGTGVTIDTFNQVGSIGIILCAVTEINTSDGTLLIAGEGAITTMNVTGGITTPVSNGTITNCNVSGGICDFTQSAEPRTVTNLKIDPVATLKIDVFDSVSGDGVVTLTNGILPINTGRVQFKTSKA